MKMGANAHKALAPIVALTTSSLFTQYKPCIILVYGLMPTLSHKAEPQFSAERAMRLVSRGLFPNR